VDMAVKLMFYGIQTDAIVRVLADIVPQQYRQVLYLVAGIIWLASFIPWVWRYLPAYWRVRADGNPG
jgi:uncharacterized protein involved in response to NO